MKFKPTVTNFIIPTYGTRDSAGFDIPNANTHDMGHDPCTSVVSLKLGFCAAIPAGHVGLIVPRSSAGKKYGIELVNTTGVIDADFRDEWQVKFTFKRGNLEDILGEKSLFQCVVTSYLKVEPKLVSNLDETDRNGGWGSTDG